MVENTLIRREKAKQEKYVSLTEISFRKFKKNKLAVVGVFIAAYIVKSLPLNILRWLVICVIFYTSISMLLSASKSNKEDNNIEETETNNDGEN